MCCTCMDNSSYKFSAVQQSHSIVKEMAIATGSSKVLHRILRAVVSENKKYCSSRFTTREFKEIKFEVPWGHVSGKWYGRIDSRPIVGLHGQQNNAGTFDTLAPLLPSHIAFLAIDLPGHGLSSWLPDGCAYHVLDYVTLMHTLMDEFKWDKISLMCHSMSGVNGFTFASLYPEKCDMLIGLDALKPITPPSDEILSSMAERIAAFKKVDERNRNRKASSYYEMDELVQKLHDGSEGSIDKECCEFILKRIIKQSAQSPHKYCLDVDQRLKTLLLYYLPNHIIIDMAHRITCPYLCIKSKQTSYYEDKANFYECVNVLKQKPNFFYHEINGKHHFHLNEPRKTADIVNPFIMKYRSE